MGVKSLANRCEDRIIAQLSEENCAERLMLADFLNISKLRASALDFMARGQQRLSKVQATEGFVKLAEKRPQLMREILAQLAPPAKKASTAMQSLPDDLLIFKVAK